MISSRKVKYFIFCIVLLSLLLIGATLKAGAISQLFTDNENNLSESTGSNLHPMVATRDGSNVFLSSRAAQIKVFTYQSSVTSAATITITIKKACTSSGVNDVLNNDMSVWINGVNGLLRGPTANSSGNCNSLGDMVFSNISLMNFMNRNNAEKKYNGMAYLTVFVQKSSNVGIKNFKVQVNRADAWATFDDDNAPTSSAYPGTDAFSVWDAQETTGAYPVTKESSMQYIFRVNYCNYPNRDDVWLKWFDADYGEFNQNSSIRWKLIDTRNGSVVASGSGAELGGDNERQRKNVGKLERGVVYRWVWDNVEKRNGIQLWVPFSEISRIEPQCDPPPRPAPSSQTGNCSRSTITKSPTILYGEYVRRNTPVGTPPTQGVHAHDPVPYSPTPGSSNVRYTDVRWDFPAAGTTLASFAKLQVSDGIGTIAEGRVGHDNGSSSPLYASPHTWTYTPNGRQITKSVTQWVKLPASAQRETRTWRNDGTTANPVWTAVWTPDATRYTYEDWGKYNIDIDTVVCYSATCEITNVSGSALGEGRVATTDDYIRVAAKLTNGNTHTATQDNLALPVSMNSGDLSLTSVTNGSTQKNTAFVPSAPISPGETVDIDFMVPNPYRSAPAGPASITAYPDFWWATAGNFYPNFGTPCSSPAFTVYAPFNITPYSEIYGTNPENPSPIQYLTRGTNSGYPVTSSYTSWLSRNGVDAKRDNGTNAYGTVTNNWSYTPPTVNAGERYCAQVTINPASGWVGPGNAVIFGQPATSNPSCFTAHNEPYVHVFGSDARAGGGFGNMCTQSNGGIQTYTRTVGERPAGSGAQFGAIARGNINGFSSATLRTSADPDPLGSIGLSFAAPAASPSVRASDMGGRFYDRHCVPDYFSKSTETGVVNGGSTSSISSIESSQPEDSARLFTPSTGTLNIAGVSNIAAGSNYVIYVNGNVRITNNIVYGTGWSVDRVPSVHIIARGNIYIDPGVTQLDGIFVAQQNPSSPDPNRTGYIDTCATASGLSDSNNPGINRCSNQLVINGAFVAHRVQLQRTFGSLRNSRSGEPYVGNTRCEKGSAADIVDRPDCAAEIFNFSPEIYFARPPYSTSSGLDDLKWDYVTSLSPVL